MNLDEPRGHLGVQLEFEGPPESFELRALPRARLLFDAPEIRDPANGGSVRESSNGWQVSGCPDPCRIQYTFALARAPRHLGRWRATEHIGRSDVITPSSFLLSPSPHGCRQSRIELIAPQDFTIAHAGGVGAEMWLDTQAIPNAVPIVLGPLEVTDVVASEGALRVVSERTLAPSPAVKSWIEREVGSLREYFTRFPVPSALLVLRPGHGGGAYHGSAHGHGGALLKISVDPNANEEELSNDWELLHELIHLTLPNLDRKHRWMEEGLSTYLGLAIRLRTGRIDAQQFWAEISSGLANALPPHKTTGFNIATTWGETYWGGALYFLRVDMAIHEATGGKFGLREVLLEVNTRGGDIRSAWPLAPLFEAERSRTGTSFLQAFEEEMGQRRSSFDLEAELDALGLYGRGRNLMFRDDAPRAETRRSFESWTLDPH